MILDNLIYENNYPLVRFHFWHRVCQLSYKIYLATVYNNYLLSGFNVTEVAHPLSLVSQYPSRTSYAIHPINNKVQSVIAKGKCLVTERLCRNTISA